MTRLSDRQRSRLKAALDGDTHSRWRGEAVPEGNVWRTRGLKASIAMVALTGFGASGLAVSAPSVPAPNGSVAAATAPKSEIDIRVGRNAGGGRLEIYGSLGARASVRMDGKRVVIRLPGNRTPDIGSLRANPPAGVTSVNLRRDDRATEIVLTLDDTAKARFGRSGVAVFVQIDTPKATAQTQARLTPPTSEKADGAADQTGIVNATAGSSSPQAPVTTAQVPVVALRAAIIDGGMHIDFPFADQAAAAVFRRGEAVWIVFDREVDLRLPASLKDGKIVRDANWARNDGFTALRLMAPASGQLSVNAEGGLWSVRLGGSPLKSQTGEVRIARDDSSGAPAMTVNLAGARKVAWIRDPAVGDRMAVITAPGPVKPLLSGRLTPEAGLGSTAHGVVVERMTPDITVNVRSDVIEISRPGGLSLSGDNEGGTSVPVRAAYVPAAYPTLMNMDNWQVLPPEGFLAHYNLLQAEAADEAAEGAEGPYTSRLDLARFLIGQGLNFEAQGVLELLGRTNPRSLNDPHVRGLLAQAKILSGRLNEARADLMSPVLANDPAAFLWRGYLAAKARDYAAARKAFQSGAGALERFPPVWRTRFAAANAYAALMTGDTKAAAELINYAVTQEVPPLERLEAQLVLAQVIEAQGDKERAMRVYNAVGKASSARISTPAKLRAARLKYELGEMKAEDSLTQMNALRFHWRGDDTEIEIVRTMGDIYLSQGRYRDALEVLRSGGTAFLNHPEALGITQRLNAAFRSLFLEGRADGLQPVEALGLFYDFRELTPVGADGDEMVRRLVRRLVDVDLLDQAADLLEYQVDNRLVGVAKASVATDLASIYLMNRQPEKALQALWKTRNSLLPRAVLSERRVLEARALTELNRTEHALEVLGADKSPEATEVRADVYWHDKAWAKAGDLLEKRLGERWKREGPLSLAEEALLIRAGVAYSLAEDQAGLTRLSTRYGPYAEKAQNRDAIRVALAGMDNGPLDVKDFSLAASQSDSFAGWVTSMKVRFRQKDDAAAKQAAAKAPEPVAG
ncbi:MAG: tetratricopeptide repeat protein [Asticcacaulis sp.]